MKLNYLPLLALASLGTFSNEAKAKDILHLEDLSFPRLKVQRTETDNPFYLNRTIIFTPTQVALDQPATSLLMDTSSLASDFVEKQNFCELHLNYFRAEGFPKTELTLESSLYPIQALIEPGTTSAGPFVFGGEGVVKYYISRALKSVDGQGLDFPQAKTQVNGLDAMVSITGIECSYKGTTSDLGNLNDAKMIHLGMGDSVLVEHRK